MARIRGAFAGGNGEEVKFSLGFEQQVVFRFVKLKEKVFWVKGTT